MAEDSGITAQRSNQLGKSLFDGIPAELKLMVLEHISSPVELKSILDAYPEWVNELWNNNRNRLFPRALENVFRYIDAELRPEVLLAYHIRRTRREYAIKKNYCAETQLRRSWLQADLRSLLSGRMPGLEMKLQTILEIAQVIWDVHLLTQRYSNDAWRRIHDIAQRTEHLLSYNSSRDLRNPPAIRLTRIEQLSFDRAFLRVEIYLLTKYWTNAQGQRHALDMGHDIHPYIPPSWDLTRRRPFDSCLRYIFDTHRGYLKKMARQLGAPELPTRDDLPWVPRQSDAREYLYKDDGTITPQGRPEIDFFQRSVSEEQRFLLWMCEFGIACVRRAHRADDRQRRDQLLFDFGRRRAWDTVELRHRVSRYDVRPDGRKPYPHPYDPHRNRHPIKSLYGGGRHEEYTETSSPWAFAAAFLDWERWLGRTVAREGLILPRAGRWLVCCDTDKQESEYMLDPDKYQLPDSWQLSQARMFLR